MLIPVTYTSAPIESYKKVINAFIVLESMSIVSDGKCNTYFF